MFGIISCFSKNDHQTIDDHFALMASGDHNYKNKRLETTALSDFFQVHLASNEHAFSLDGWNYLFDGFISNLQQITTTSAQPEQTTIHLQELIAKHGVAIIEKLQGDFIFIAFQQKTKKIKCFRPVLGCVPLYYSFVKNHFYFSTSFRRISAIPSLQKINWNFVKQTLSHRFLDSGLIAQTWMQPIHKLEPGYSLAIDSGQSKITRYSNIPFPTKLKLASEAQYIYAFQDKLEHTIDRYCADIDTIFSEYSGGMDSTVITKLAHDQAIKNKKSFKSYILGLTPDQKENDYKVKDDVDAASLLAKNSEMPQPIVATTSSDYPFAEWQQKPQIPKQQIQKSFRKDYLQKIAEAGGKFILSGQGGDSCVTFNTNPFEINRFLFNAFLGMRWKSLWNDRKAFGWKKIIVSIFSENRFFRSILHMIFPKSVVFAPRRISLKSLKSTGLLKAPCLQNESKKTYSLREEIVARLESPSVIDNIEQEQELADFYGLRIRYPFMDYELISFLMSLPSEIFILNGENRRLYKETAKKWIKDESFSQQRKSRVSTAPILTLRAAACMDKQLIDYAKIYASLPKQLKQIVRTIDFPDQWDELKSQYCHDMLIKLHLTSLYLKQFTS